MSIYFSGDTQEAIHRSKAERKPLVVFLKGCDGGSSSMDALLSSGSFSGILADAFVLRLDDDLEDAELPEHKTARMFRQYFPTDVLPTIMMLGMNSRPLLVIKGELDGDQLMRQLQEAAAAFKLQLPKTPEPLDGNARPVDSPAACDRSGTEAANVSSEMASTTDPPSDHANLAAPHMAPPENADMGSKTHAVVHDAHADAGAKKVRECTPKDAKEEVSAGLGAASITSPSAGDGQVPPVTMPVPAVSTPHGTHTPQGPEVVNVQHSSDCNPVLGSDTGPTRARDLSGDGCMAGTGAASEPGSLPTAGVTGKSGPVSPDNSPANSTSDPKVKVATTPQKCALSGSSRAEEQPKRMDTPVDFSRDILPAERTQSGSAKPEEGSDHQLEGQQDVPATTCTASDLTDGKIHTLQPGIVGTSVDNNLLPQYSSTTLQFRLTNGESLTGEFPADATLAEAWRYVELHRTDGKGPFNLEMHYPKITFESCHGDKTLQELDLVPRCALYVVNRVEEAGKPAHSTPPVAPSGFSLFLQWLWRIVMAIRLFLGLAGDEQASNKDAEDTGADSELPGEDVEFRPSANQDTSEGVRRRKNYGSNIHGIDDSPDSKPSGNTYWNGNSTQFGGNDDDLQ